MNEEKFIKLLKEEFALFDKRLNTFATKEDLASLDKKLNTFATKEDLASLDKKLSNFATKEEFSLLNKKLNDFWIELYSFRKETKEEFKSINNHFDEIKEKIDESKSSSNALDTILEKYPIERIERLERHSKLPIFIPVLEDN